MANQMCPLVRVPFQGDTLEAIENDRGVWVILKRACENLGLAEDAQRVKLQSKPWAVTTIIVATAADGKSYEMLALHLDSVPMWLATIETRRVRQGIRKKLELYQKLAAKTLADWFYGRQKEDPSSQQFVALVERVAGLVERLDARMTRLEQLHTPEIHPAVAALNEKVEALLRTRTAMPKHGLQEWARYIWFDGDTDRRIPDPYPGRIRERFRREAHRYGIPVGPMTTNGPLTVDECSLHLLTKIVIQFRKEWRESLDDGPLFRMSRSEIRVN